MNISRVIFLIISFLFILLAGAYFFNIMGVKVRLASFTIVSNIFNDDKDVAQETFFSNFLKEKIISLPGPLVGIFDTAESGINLSVDEVFTWTNINRGEYGFPPFLLNETLSVAAEIKVDDMFSKEYFEHVSPDGIDIDDIMEQAKYTYISVGENLALGNFKDERALVIAWMESPGHRANILNDSFTEIGIAVKKGIYEGREVWIAVQEFGRPRSDCPYVSSALLSQIDRNKTKLDASSDSINILQKELELFMPKHGNLYNQKVTIFNENVTKHNILLEETKLLIERYNKEVATFNACLQ